MIAGEMHMARNPLTPFRPGGLGGDPFMSLHREMNRLFDDVFRSSLGGGGGERGAAGTFVPAHMNVSETENEFRITAELPGVSEKDIDISLEDDVLTIRGEKRFEESRGGEKENFHFVERSYGTFQRSLRLPVRVEPEQVQARVENGVLVITLPKSTGQERSRRIQIRGGQAGDPSGEGSQGGGSDQKSSGGAGP
jgi:HSP20 family protein